LKRKSPKQYISEITGIEYLINGFGLKKLTTGNMASKKNRIRKPRPDNLRSVIMTY
jgi:hypothetical protein